MSERHFFADTASGTLEFTGDVTVDADDFEASEAETVTLDSPWNDFFGTNEYVTFEGTVAQPIVQPYFYDGELRHFRKDEAELKEAQAQIDNLPWTTGHPENKRVEHPEQIKGFWRDPRWNDGQMATLHIPTNDPESVRFAVHNDNLSIGFSGTLDWVDEEDTKEDAVQRDYVYDHIGSVESGRCSPEDGCALHTDSEAFEDLDEVLETHGHVVDGVRTTETEELQWSEGDWVAFTVDGDTAYGKITYVDAERALVKRYYTDDESFAVSATTLSTASLREWVGPHADSCGGHDCGCGLHTDSEEFTDAPEGIYEEDGDWYGIAPSETADDEPKYELNNCNDVKDAYNLRNNGDYDVETSALVARIKRASEAHDCPPEQKPWTDSDTMTDSITEFIDEHDLTAEDVIDSLDLEIKDEPTDFYDGEPSTEDLAEDFDAVDLLLDKKEELEAEVETLNDELREKERPIFEDKAEELAEMTEKWGDKEALVEKFDAEDEDERWTVDDLDEKIELVEDIKGEETTTMNDDGVEETEEEDDGPFDLRERTQLD